jgi:hypothetical protein
LGLAGASGPTSLHAPGSSGSAGTSGPSGTASTSGTVSAINPSGSAGSSAPLTPVNSVVDIADVANPPAPTVPSNDTDLIFILGTNRLTLSAQRPLIHVIVQDAIENIRASLLFDHAFPNAAQAINSIQESLFTAAEKYRPGASAIATRLHMDNEYLGLMVRLVNKVPIYLCISHLICC